MRNESLIESASRYVNSFQREIDECNKEMREKGYYYNHDFLCKKKYEAKKNLKHWKSVKRSNEISDLQFTLESYGLALGKVLLWLAFIGGVGFVADKYKKVDLLPKVMEYNKEVRNKDWFFIDGEAPNQSIAIKIDDSIYIKDENDFFNRKNSKVKCNYTFSQIIDMKNISLQKEIEKVK